MAVIGCFLVSREGGGRVGSGGCVGGEGVWELGAKERDSWAWEGPSVICPPWGPARPTALREAPSAIAVTQVLPGVRKVLNSNPSCERPPSISDSGGLGGAREPAFLASSQAPGWSEDPLRERVL